MRDTLKSAPAITAAVGDIVINDLLDQLPYPFTVQLPSSRDGAPSEGDFPSEYAWALDDGRTDAVEDEADIGRAILVAAIKGYLEADQVGAPDPSDRELYDLIAARVGQSPGRTESSVMSALEADSAAFARAFADALARVASVSIQWVKVTVVRRPLATLGNPLRIGNLNLKVQAKVRACIRIFGRRICTDVTSPNVEFQAQEVRIDLQTRGLQIWAVPSIKNIDLVIRVRILGVSFTFTIGVTGVVNGLLKDRSVMVFDATTLRFPLPTLNRAFAVTAVEVPATTGATTVNLSGTYTPL
ncbi:hypothetical protein [Brevundimonas subvibrioides]|uniref:Uncharacterized protein n=1 Tax=Brevundimonas subvibrioides (strain ATCC 15264 / DSM 4735 / LMG 14903 / NBRC 16000 / CB 81) TaxID=633149 RepID=D9QIQ2_BRESC|nr:hypothetical protein [Brevundimonas subvibrioides]ADL01385.1 hypothetical protein Bresu_2075 [Brevundimonas subvibrioides ATCC 15264]